MKRLFLTFATASALISLAFAAPAMADFGINEFDATFTNQDPAFAGPITTATQAGSHPFATTTTIELNSRFDPEYNGGELVPDGAAKELIIHLPPGFVGDPEATPHCSSADFLKIEFLRNACPNGTAIGFIGVRAGFGGHSSACLYTVCSRRLGYRPESALPRSLCRL